MSEFVFFLAWRCSLSMLLCIVFIEGLGLGGVRCWDIIILVSVLRVSFLINVYLLQLPVRCFDGLLTILLLL